MNVESKSSAGADEPENGSDRSESERGDRAVKKVSALAVASVVFVLVAFFFIALTCGFGSHNVIMPSVGLLFSIAALVLGVSALIVIWVNRRRVRGIGYAVAGIIFGALFALVMLTAIDRLVQCRRVALCMNNLHQLAVAIDQYAKVHEGYLPGADKWCDLLMESDANLSGNVFKCPGAKEGPSTYAFNEALDGWRLSDVNEPEHVVLVFEAGQGWNLSGQKESIKMRHQSTKGRFSNVLFCDFHTGMYGEEELAKSLVRWKP